MGCAQSNNAAASGDAFDPSAEKESQRIDQDLKREKSLERKTTKMLLLGSGESGKSTVVKQFKLIHQGAPGRALSQTTHFEAGGYNDADRQEYVEVVVQNVVQSMKAILDALPDLNIRIEADAAVNATVVQQAPSFVGVQAFREDLARPVWALWKTRQIKEAISRRNEFQLNDSAEYFFARVPKMAKPDYQPDDDDILRSRVKTMGVVEHQVKVRDRLFKITDVGGQRSERKKWLNVFSDINVLLFITSLAEYDQKLREDHQTSRLDESLTLFETIVNSSWFEKSAIILFLNKMDLFVAKLPSEPIERHVHGFPADRGLEPEYASKWLRQRFLDLNHNPAKAIYPHFTCATDTKGMQVVLSAVVDSVLRSHFAQSGLI